jgi:nucleotide-binding universal stress UspA family protein
MRNSVVVPLDGSTFGEHALPLALEVAQRAQVPLHLVHVHVSLAPIYADAIRGLEMPREFLARQQAADYLESVAHRLRKAASVTVTPVPLDGSLPEGLQEYTVKSKPDLVVMTTHGRGPLSRFWLGSVADQFIRCTTTPVLLVHPSEEKPDLENPPSLKHILIPLDGSPLAEQVLLPALTLGQLVEAAYLLLRVVEPLLYIGADPIGYVPRPIDPGWLEQEEEDAHKYLVRISRRLRDQGLQVHSRVVAGGSPAAFILQEARDRAMSLIALSTHGRRGLARLVLGSVADKVVRGFALPVLVYRPKDT